LKLVNIIEIYMEINGYRKWIFHINGYRFSVFRETEPCRRLIEIEVEMYIKIFAIRNWLTWLWRRASPQDLQAV
jgi:hypothetical protein